MITFAPLLEVSLRCPEGWRWVSEDEWREELALVDVDLERWVGMSAAEIPFPLCVVTREPRSFEGASTSVFVDQLPAVVDGERLTPSEVISHTLTFCVRAWENCVAVTWPRDATFDGRTGRMTRVIYTQPRKSRPPIRVDSVMYVVPVGDRLVQVCASAAEGAPRTTWTELDRVLAGIRLRWVRPRPALFPPGKATGG